MSMIRYMILANYYDGWEVEKESGDFDNVKDYWDCFTEDDIETEMVFVEVLERKGEA